MTLNDLNVNWAEEFNGAITVCDRDGIIVYMNHRSVDQFQKYGGDELLGSNLLDCHPEPSRTRLKEMLEKPLDNMYTTEKDGKTKIIYQTPWYQDTVFRGVIEISFQLDAAIPHFMRK
ncbi:MAG: PAS domain-containing protein [Draconibacterium sp.]